MKKTTMMAAVMGLSLAGCTTDGGDAVTETSAALSAGWSAHNTFTEMGNLPTASSDLSPYTFFGLQKFVYRRASDGHVMEAAFNAQYFSAIDWTDFTAEVPAAGKPFGFTSGNAELITFRSGVGHVHLMVKDTGGSHSYADLTAISSGRAAAGDPVGLMVGDQPNVVYRGTDNHIIINYLPQGGGDWGAYDLSRAYSLPYAASDPVAFMFKGVERIAYRTTSNHVEVFSVTPGSPTIQDITAKYNWTPAAGKLSTYVFSGYMVITFRGTDNHVHIFYDNGDLVWGAGDLTVLSNANPTASDPWGYSFDSDGTQHLVYRDALTGDVMEIFDYFGGVWQVNDLTVASGAPHSPAAQGVPSGMATPGWNMEHVFYRDTNGTIFDLRSPP